MEIKASCVFDYETIKALHRQSMFKKGNPKKGLIFLTVFTVVYVLLIVVLNVLRINWSNPLDKPSGVESTFVTCLIIAACCLVMLYYLYFVSPRQSYSSLYKMKNMRNDYVFSEEKMTVISTGSGFDGRGEQEYSTIYKVIETSKHFFIYQDKRRAFIVDKSTIKGGTAEDIRNAISAAMPNKKKYTLCKH